MRKPLYLLLFLVIAICTTGCGASLSKTMSDACIQANAVVASIGAYVDDAKAHIELARAIAENLPEGEVRDKAMAAVRGADDALAKVTSTATKISEKCTQDVDLVELFKGLAVAWDGVKKLLDTFGGTSPGLLDPAAYTMVKARGG